jgi:2-amino-4-hydroxy-6-hydroxymethyldihydropteridine diphosphokinase
MAEQVYIGLGANLNDPIDTINEAIEALKSLPQCQFLSVSKIYRSAPMGPADQPDYINCVVAITTDLTAIQLFQHTCDIEQQHGRTRDGEHWGPRTLDLDILLFGSDMINNDVLTIPHYGLQEREFVIYPLLDIAPDLVLPCGKPVKDLTKNISLNGMKPIN